MNSFGSGVAVNFAITAARSSRAIRKVDRKGLRIETTFLVRTSASYAMRSAEAPKTVWLPLARLDKPHHRFFHVHDAHDADVIGRPPQVKLASLVIIRPGGRRARASPHNSGEAVCFDVNTSQMGRVTSGFRSGFGSNRGQKGREASNQRRGSDS